MLNLSAVTERKGVPSFVTGMFLVIKSRKEGGEDNHSAHAIAIPNTRKAEAGSFVVAHHSDMQSLKSEYSGVESGIGLTDPGGSFLIQNML